MCATCFGRYLGHHQAYQCNKFKQEDIIKSKWQSIQRTNLLILLINELKNYIFAPKIATELREENLKKKIPRRTNIIQKNHRKIVALILTTTHEELNLIKKSLYAHFKNYLIP